MNNLNFQDTLTPTIEMNEPNEPIVIHKGKFDLVGKLIKKKWKVTGEIYFDWFPQVGVKFEGKVDTSKKFSIDIIRTPLKIHIDSLPIEGEFHVTKSNHAKITNGGWKIEGIITSN